MSPTARQKKMVLGSIAYLTEKCRLLRRGAIPRGWMDNEFRMFQVHLEGIRNFVERVETSQGEIPPVVRDRYQEGM